MPDTPQILNDGRPIDEWTPAMARSMAAQYLAGTGRRWRHVQAVGAKAEALTALHGLPQEIACAAWLHDIGYAAALTHTGFHPLDGARCLHDLDAPSGVVSLVAYHSGAAFEAAERGLTKELAAITPPHRGRLDLLTLLDMSTGPDGTSKTVPDRLAEILTRYEPGSPVHRAVTRSSAELLASCARAATSLAVTPDESQAARDAGRLPAHAGRART